MSAKRANNQGIQAAAAHSRFFESDPAKWTIITFLNYSKHSRALDSRRKILDAWTKELERIVSCDEDDHGHKRSHCKRAQSLLDRYKETNSADRKYGRDWVKCQKPGPQQPALPPATINYAPVFQNGGSAALIQNGGSAPVYNYNKPSTTTDKLDGVDSNRSSPPPDLLEVEEPKGEEDTSDEDEDGHDDDATNDSDTSSTAPPHVEAFNTAYLKTAGHRWRLLSGRDVETVLHDQFYKGNCKGFYQNLARSFILDLGEEDAENNISKGWFSIDEWAEITATVPELPQAAVIQLFKSLDRFDGLKTTTEFRLQVGATHFLPEGETYVRKDHYDLWSADLAVQQVLGLWEDPNQPLRTQQLEESLSSALWAPIIDHPIRGLRGVQMVHKESCCKSTASRKCRERTETSERQASGPKIDGIIRSIEDDSLEFGSMEVSKSWGGVGGKSTKRLGDIEKVIKTLRDMLFQLHERVEFNAAVTKKLQVVGIICCGLKVQFFRMYSKGHVAVLKRETVETVPVECSNFKDLKRLITKFAMMKNVIAQSVAASKEHHALSATPANTDQTDEARLEALLFNRAEGSSGPRLGMGGDTPPPGW